MKNSLLVGFRPIDGPFRWEFVSLPGDARFPFYGNGMPDHETTVRSRELGEGIRRMIERAGLNGKQIAAHLGWPQSEVSRMLSGKRAVKETDVAKLVGICRASPEDGDRLMALCREALRPGWYQQHGSRLPSKLRTYLDHEDKAIALYDYQAMLLPGSLQIPDYARTVISKIVNVPADEVDERVAARMARSAIFSRPHPASFHFFVHEFVLRLPVGGSTVMSEQLHHLLRLSVRPHIAVHIIPAAVGAHAGVEGSFTMMEFSGIKPVVYLENATTTVFLEEPEEIDSYRHIVAALAETALPREQSRELIRDLAVELYGEPHDEDA